MSVTAGPKMRATCCGAVIQSMHVHDFVRCACGETFVDGGSEYLRSAGNVEPVEDDDGRKPRKGRKAK